MKHTNPSTSGALILSLLTFFSTIAIGASACKPSEVKELSVDAVESSESESSESGEPEGSETSEAFRSEDMEPRSAISNVCWTFVRKPQCEQDPIPQFTCCDGMQCYTFDSEPDCVEAQGVFVCCVE